MQQQPLEDLVASEPLATTADRDVVPVVQHLTVTNTDELTRKMAKRRVDRRR